MDLEFVVMSLIVSVFAGVFVFSLSMGEYWLVALSVLMTIYAFGVWSEILDMRYIGLDLEQKQ